MIDVGIITNLYKNFNYGGILQAYALTEFISNQGYRCEQIQYDNRYDNTFMSRMKLRVYQWYHLMPLKKMRDWFCTIPVKAQIDLRQNAMNDFIEKYIPTSECVYNRKNIARSTDEYRCFVAGSDQIWSALSETNLLDFVPAGRYKFSYAASIARDQLVDKQKELFKKNLPGFQAVSVREKQSVDQLAELGIESQWVLDPTMLLSREQWDTICCDRMVDEPYIFCYFLSEDMKLRKIAAEYAGKRNVKIVALPYLLKTFNEQDKQFGDIQLFDVSPAGFLSLIKYSELVLTDSFHGTVFSSIYHKPFMVFERPPMNTRIVSLLHVLQCEDQLIDCAKDGALEQMERRSVVLDDKDNDTLIQMTNSSKQFLEMNLKKGLEE